MKLTMKIMAAPITGLGMMLKKEASCGRKASAM